jgi:cytochrome c-type biogenesis protein
MFDVAHALAAGFLTIAAPCVLPMLPIILGASLGHHDPIRPLLIAIGFALTFSLIAFLFGLFPSILGYRRRRCATRPSSCCCCSAC